MNSVKKPAMSRKMLLLVGLVNAAAYHFAYVTFLNPLFEYAEYRYYPPGVVPALVTYLLAILPLLAQRATGSPAHIGAALIYVLNYVPMQLTILFMREETDASFMLVEVLLSASMTAILYCSTTGKQRTFTRSPEANHGKLPIVMGVLGIAAVLLTVLEFRDTMRLVSFASIYELRTESANVKTSFFTDYMILWLTYVIGPYLLARAVLRKELPSLIVAAASFLVVYAATGAKVSLLIPFLVIAVKVLDPQHPNFLPRLMLAAAAFVFLTVSLVPDEGAGLWFKSVLILRTFGSNGWVAAIYEEFFRTHPHTYYSHIGVINSLTGWYPFEQLSMGQVISREYLRTGDANFNAGFWASDAFAAAGLLGIPIITAVLSAFMFTLDRFARGTNTLFVNLWLPGFWMAVVNVPFSTALLSCGGLLILMILMVWRHSPSTAQPESRALAVRRAHAS